MKTSFKVLFLILSFAVVFSTTAFASTHFSDDESIKYKTAVGVMSSIGVISGYSDGSFKPSEFVTREQAAKMITYSVLGEQGVTEPIRTEKGFSDVSSDRWSAPYINWCEQNNIIQGYGDGKFDPTGSVTGYQLAKMLLCAVGYGKNGEYTGSSWDLQIAKDAFKYKIFSGVVVSDLNMPVTREEAAVYIYNTIIGIEKVIYIKDSSIYIPADGTEICDNTIAASAYGIVASGPNATIIKGVITENNANSDNNTTINGEEFNYDTGIDLLGHSVSVYTNGEKNAKEEIYYIADESISVEVKQAINTKEDFIKTFGNDFFVPATLIVYNDEGILGKQTVIPGLNLLNSMAPAGTYIFHDEKLVTYFPNVAEFAAVVGQEHDGVIRIGEKEYSTSAIISKNGKYSAGQVVLAKAIGSKLHITFAKIASGSVLRIDKNYYGLSVYTIKGFQYTESSIRDETSFPKIQTPEYGSEYIFYLDSQGEIFAIVPAK